VTIFLDTNILLYAISTAGDEAGKRNKALQLLDRPDCVLSVQVLQEFYVQATRASRKNPLPHDTAVSLTETWLRFPIQENTLEIFHAALDLRKTSGFSFWDCAIIAAASEAGCDQLYSEDMAHGRKIANLKIVNPFRGL
jgi:predicted nucleic acid-binding protein